TQLFYSVAVHSRGELSLAPDEYAGFVMACLRMLALVPPGTTPPDPPSGNGSATDRAESHDAPEVAPSAPAVGAGPVARQPEPAASQPERSKPDAAALAGSAVSAAPDPVAEKPVPPRVSGQSD